MFGFREIRVRWLLACFLSLVTGLVLPVAAVATPTGWSPIGGVTDPADYADYESAVVGDEYQADIEEATELGLVVGHEDRTFRPDDNVTVGQFANIIARNYWQQGANDAENLDYLRTLGVSADDPDSALTVDQLRTISDAVQGRSGVAELAVLGQIQDGSLVPSGSGGGISRGQAVDLVSRNTAPANGETSPPSSGNRSAPGGEPPIAHPPHENRNPSLSARISPNPAQRLQTVTVTATVRRIISATARLPWGDLVLSGSSSQLCGSSTVPLEVADGTYDVLIEGVTTSGDTLRKTVHLTVRGSILDDVRFIITD